MASNKEDKKLKPRYKPRDLQNLYGAQLVASARMRFNMRDDQNFAEGDIFPDENNDVNHDFQRSIVRLNLARTAVTLLLGTYASSAGEVKIIPGMGGDGPDGKKAQADAQLKNLVVRHHESHTHAKSEIRKAVKQAITVGIAWLHDHHYTRIDDFGKKTVVIEKEHEDWQRCVWDTSFRKADFSDGMYFFAHRYLDKDQAIGLFKDKKKLILENLQDWTPYENPIDAWESYYRGGRPGGTGGVPSGGMFGDERGVDIDQYYASETFAASTGGGGERQGIWCIRAWWREFKVEDGCLREIVFYQDFLANSAGSSEWIPLSDAYTWFFIPYTPIIYGREPKAGFPRGAVYDMKEPTRHINTAISQMLNASTSQRLMIEESALGAMFADIPMASFEEKVARVQKSMNQLGQLIIVNDGAVSGKQIQWENNETRFAQANNVASLLLPLFQNFVSAVNPASLGAKSNADSGVAIGRMQQQTVISFKEPLDNIYLATKLSGQKFLQLIEHFDVVNDFYERDDILRGTDQVSPNDILERGGWEYDGYAMNLMRAKYNVIVAPVSGTENEKVMDAISGFTRSNPEAGSLFMPLMIRLMDIPQSREYSEKAAAMLKRQGVPVSDDLLSEEDRDDMQQESQAAAEQQQKDAAIQEKMVGVEIGKGEAEIKLKEAQALKAEREALMVGMENGEDNSEQIMEIVQQLLGQNKRLKEQTQAQGNARAAPTGQTPEFSPPEEAAGTPAAGNPAAAAAVPGGGGPAAGGDGLFKETQ